MFSTRIERTRIRRRPARRVIGEKVKRTRDGECGSAIYLNRSHAQPSVDTRRERERERERQKKTERKKDADEIRASKHVLRWCIRHHKTGALDFTACRTSTSADKIKFSRNERTDVRNRNRGSATTRIRARDACNAPETFLLSISLAATSLPCLKSASQ